MVLVTTAGFEDVLEIGRQARPKLYDFFGGRPDPLVPRERRFGVRERVSSDGEIVSRLSPTDVRKLVRKIKRMRPDAVAICFLFSFRNPAHEKSLAGSLRAAGFRVTVSHEVLPAIREFERTSTTVVNAYLIPVMSKYLFDIEKIAARAAGGSRNASRVRVMQSNGGIISAGAAAAEPVRTILSGPAGGVLGAEYVGALAGYEKIISFDMGGTSTDVALLEGSSRTTDESIVDGLPVSVPMLDIHTVGAGGGSIARFDRGGALRVGPESAGADPGPIAYGKGEQPTVTDAHLILGRLGGKGLLENEFPLDLERARRYFARDIENSGIASIERLAQGIIDVVESTMERAIRVISIERGYDTRDYALVAFGGAGGLHACALAAALEMPRVIIPKIAGGLSALGILRADVVRDFSQTVLLRATDAGGALRTLGRAFRGLAQRGLAQMRDEGFAPRAIRAEQTLDVRYVGQNHWLRVAASQEFRSAFHREHERRFGYADSSREIEIVNIALRLTGLTPKPALPRARATKRGARKAIEARNQVYFSGAWRSTAVYARDRLQAGHRIIGPAIITDYSSTTVVLPDWHLQVDAYGNLILSQTHSGS